MATLNLSVHDCVLEWVNAQIKTGRYVSASDYLCDLIMHDQMDHESITLALIEGEQSGISNRTVQDIISSAKAE